MLRTRNRPVAAGRLRPAEALAFGLAAHRRRPGSSCASAPGRWPRCVALVTWASYLFAYTPLKTRTSLSTIVGAFPGALPPVIGWAAARGQHRAGRVRALRDPVPLADPALPRHRLDLPRGLRARRPAHAARARPRRPHHRPPGRGQQPRPAPRERGADDRRAWPAASTSSGASCLGHRASPPWPCGRAIRRTRRGRARAVPRLDRSTCSRSARCCSSIASERDADRRIDARRIPA